MNNLFSLVFLVIIMFTVYGCDSPKTEKQNSSESFLKENKKCTFYIDSLHFMTADVKNGLIQYLYNDSTYTMGSSYSIFNKYGQVLSTESKTKFGDILINEFQDGQVFRSSKYVWDSRITNYRPQELRVYRDGVIDETEGNFVDVKITNDKGRFVEFDLRYIGAFNFQKGVLLFGRKVNDYSDEENLSKLSFEKNPTHFRIKKSKIVFGSDSSFQCLVKVTTDTLSKSKFIQRKFVNDSWTSNFLIRRDWQNTHSAQE